MFHRIERRAPLTEGVFRLPRLLSSTLGGHRLHWGELAFDPLAHHVRDALRDIQRILERRPRHTGEKLPQSGSGTHLEKLDEAISGQALHYSGSDHLPLGFGVNKW